jgi:hypothetical protein
MNLILKMADFDLSFMRVSVKFGRYTPKLNSTFSVKPANTEFNRNPLGSFEDDSCGMWTGRMMQPPYWEFIL